LPQAVSSKCRISKETGLVEMGPDFRAMAFSSRIGKGVNTPLYVKWFFEFIKTKATIFINQAN
jgi:hypothetical protein